jgi:hypothetical protein
MLKISVAVLMLAQGLTTALTCTGSCHGPSLIAQQRLDTAGWTREVNKMIGWGAVVPDNEKDALVAFLARTFNNNRPRPASSKDDLLEYLSEFQGRTPN